MSKRHRKMKKFSSETSNEQQILNFPFSQVRRRNQNFVVIPRNEKQEELLLALEDPNISIVFAVGPAGTGKTLISTYWALTKLFKEYNKIVITRPNVAVDDRDIGFLPGDMIKKMYPWMLPIIDIFREKFSDEKIIDFIKSGIVEIVPIAYIRGRTFKNSIIIVDEAQGLTVNSMKAVLTRIGEGSKMVVTGDIKQTDHEVSGLEEFIRKAKKSDLKHLKIVEFTTKEVERHPAVKEVLQFYGEE